MLGLFFGFALYSLFENELTIYFPNKSKKIITNFLAATHIINLLLLSLIYYATSYNLMIERYILYNTCGYFCYDALTFIKTRSFSFGDVVLIYHHIIISIYFLSPSVCYSWYVLLIYAELSNIPGIFVYHYLQLKKSGEHHQIKLQLLKELQFYIYSFFRCGMMSYYIFIELKLIYYSDESGNLYFYATLPLYFLAYFWSYILYNSRK